MVLVSRLPTLMADSGIAVRRSGSGQAGTHDDDQACDFGGGCGWNVAVGLMQSMVGLSDGRPAREESGRHACHGKRASWIGSGAGVRVKKIRFG
jgi:hypothetical protein